ncbi:crotonase/enoyl-CoA hydratase family protein [Parasphingorhabdus halotolerans]|uniref:Crotonase/enoyl-CoA hydratase family protein n=1 Tax=Parasphingorhabdus halotolerans TaxID=2725558 RepID=A0A6H2DMN1_9SPHN|nr:crotonase/enoyl-CoA hydratase family protein [Parasphingorhabdus halotolerans]QJB69640.1 crotonase/enoyl-CoA hydratase family protein [Parasphingorhabdus halotolerans]
MTIALTIEDDVATITLDDGKANAINPDWMAAFIETFSKAEAGATAIVIAGRDGVFSGGFDLKWLATNGAEKGPLLLDLASQMVIRVYGSPRPVVAACTGHAIAMGAFLLLTCDSRIGTKGDYKFGANETMNNMNLPVFAVELPRDRLRNAYLTASLIQSQMYNPDKALEVGYVDQLAERGSTINTAVAVASQLGKLPGRAYGANKLLLRQPTIDLISAAIGKYG